MPIPTIRAFPVAICLLAGACASAAAQTLPKSDSYSTMGLPRDVKVKAEWNRYHDYDEAAELLRQLAAEHPAHARLQSLGKSHGGREMWLIAISNFERGAEADKPAFWIDGGIHANEIQAVEVPLYTAWYLLEMYGQNDFVTRLLDERVFYIVPMMSPDSRDAHFHEPNTTHSPRSGQRPVDDDQDGQVDEDGPDDLDGDGSITQMRIRDPRGRFVPHADYPDLLVPAAPDKPGQYTLLGAEGQDNDGDGQANEDGDGFYDPNRNWAWNWQAPSVQFGAHQYPFSIIENRWVADFVMAHPNIAGAQSYHNAGGMILRGPGGKNDQYNPADLAVYDEIGRRGETILPGYRYINVANDLYEAFGGELDWFYAMRGVFTFTNELFPAFNLFRRQSAGFFGGEEELHVFNKYLLFGAGWQPWREVDHPQYGKVEIGGFKKEWVRQPPSFLLEEECHRNMAFTLYHADQMPRVAVFDVAVRQVAGGLQEVTATIVNERATPTHAAVDVEHKFTPPDLATVAGTNATVLAGFTAGSRLFADAVEQSRDPARLKLANIPGRGTVYARWLIRGAGPFVVSVKSAKGGSASKTSE